jgi:hypothetical protein
MYSVVHAVKLLRELVVRSYLFSQKFGTSVSSMMSVKYGILRIYAGDTNENLKIVSPANLVHIGSVQLCHFSA